MIVGVEGLSLQVSASIPGLCAGYVAVNAVSAATIDSNCWGEASSLGHSWRSG